MKILALDLAKRTGVAFGNANELPRIIAWRVAKTDQGPDDAARNLGCHLRDILCLGVDLIAVENHLSPDAQLSYDAVVNSLYMHGAVDAVAGCYGVRVVRVSASTVRKHFCGKASALPPTRRGEPKRTARQKQDARMKTKKMVWDRCVTLGYFERGEPEDYDKADACALFDYAAHTEGKVARPFALFKA